MAKVEKKVKVGFYITGQDDKRKKITTPDLFVKVWNDFFSDALTRKPVSEKMNIGEASIKDLVLFMDEYDTKENVFFGYIGVFRDSILPTIFSKTNGLDKNIPLEDSDEILEKNYFMYYMEKDILVFQQNRLGPRADDLAYFLFKATHQSRVSFESIIRGEDMRSLLEHGSVLKNAQITIALPRHFEPGSFELENSWASHIIKMMSDSGMSRINLQVWGRARVKKSEQNYIVDNIKDGLRELLSKCTLGTGDSRIPWIPKAEAQVENNERKNLINKELTETPSVMVEKGYATRDRIKLALVLAYTRQENELAMYAKDVKK
ncbi:hypothetical protein [Aeromonas hydrophila]|uniref:hypothetical protein n=1 Tax=Aeromonas hydrophila TaxID=644 RepID=UPI00080AC179|nr:hypothetical protein [Aeromonas hydrophila]ANT69181.1 hypothetical protein TK34_17985 [Aeromonas hydrophila]